MKTVSIKVKAVMKEITTFVAEVEVSLPEFLHEQLMGKGENAYKGKDLAKEFIASYVESIRTTLPWQEGTRKLDGDIAIYPIAVEGEGAGDLGNIFLEEEDWKFDIDDEEALEAEVERRKNFVHPFGD